jgi:hypothetical protein
MGKGVSKADDERTTEFGRNSHLEALLKDLNSTLWPAEQRTLPAYKKPELPIILIMGPGRSGTTLFMQWLANTGIVAYPTNLLSRFYQAPIIGAKIQLMLTDPKYDFKGELGEFAQRATYESANGKTLGALAPNEFWYFWRRFLPNPDRDDLSNAELEKGMDTATLLSELAGLADVFKKPFALKALLFNNNIEFLNKIIENSIFIQIRRKPLFNIQSMLEARERQLGSRNNWYSFKIKEYEMLAKLDPVHQVAGQIYFTNKAVTEGLSKIPESKKMSIAYEDFCRDPAQVYNTLIKKLAALDYQVEDKYTGESSFKAKDQWQGSKKEAEIINSAHQSFSREKTSI